VTASVLCALLVGYAVPKWSLIIPVRAAEAVTAEEKQAVKKLEEELAVLKKNRSFAQETYEAALAAYEAAELDYVKAKEAKEALDAEISALESEIDTTNQLLPQKPQRFPLRESGTCLYLFDRKWRSPNPIPVL